MRYFIVKINKQNISMRKSDMLKLKYVIFNYE